MSELQEGTKIKAIYGPAPKELSFTTVYPDDKACYNSCHVRSIEVVDIPGQMGNVPWAKVINRQGEVILVNLALMESVEMGKTYSGKGAEIDQSVDRTTGS